MGEKRNRFRRCRWQRPRRHRETGARHVPRDVPLDAILGGISQTSRPKPGAQSLHKLGGSGMACRLANAAMMYAKTLPKYRLESAMNSMLAHRKNAVCHKSC